MTAIEPPMPPPQQDTSIETEPTIAEVRARALNRDPGCGLALGIGASVPDWFTPGL
jgi:hypothetical protein